MGNVGLGSIGLAVVWVEHVFVWTSKVGCRVGLYGFELGWWGESGLIGL